MSMKNFQELTNGQDIRDAGNFDTWAHRASNDASDFFRSQSRNHGIDRESQHLLTSLEITPIFTNHNSFQAGRGAFQPDRFMDGLRRLDPDLSDVVTPCPPGFDRARWYGGDKSPEYTLARGMANSMNELSSIPDAASRKPLWKGFCKIKCPSWKSRALRCTASRASASKSTSAMDADHSG